MMFFEDKVVMAAVIAMFAGTCYAGGTIPSAIGSGPPSTGSTEGGISIVGPTPAPGVPYYEYFNYSAYAKRSYVPGYTPHVTSLYENPRDYPWALGALATPYYQYAGKSGWFFGSPQGYQSSVPKGSQAAKYYRGELGITDHLRGGYPQGMRVVEPAIVPIASSSERGGIYIHGGGVELMVGGEAEITSQQSQTDYYPPPAPPVMPRPVPTPESLEK